MKTTEKRSGNEAFPVRMMYFSEKITNKVIYVGAHTKSGDAPAGNAKTGIELDSAIYERYGT